MASFISSRERIGFWLVASRLAAVAGIVLALVGAWHADGVTARSNTALVPNARGPWPALFEGGVGGHVSLEARNMAWLQERISKGATIFDIGPDLERGTRSVFYSKEIALLKANNYVWKFVRYGFVNGELCLVGEWVPK